MNGTATTPLVAYIQAEFNESQPNPVTSVLIYDLDWQPSLELFYYGSLIPVGPVSAADLTSWGPTLTRVK